MQRGSRKSFRQLSRTKGLWLMAEKTEETRPAHAFLTPLGTCCKVEERRENTESQGGKVGGATARPEGGATD